jgi:AcrR family transcriptional regulator
MPWLLDTVKFILHIVAMDQTPSPPHHHGNLREALIVAGMDLLNEGGIGALTLRRAAARAGVSHAAPAHHFAGLPGLLTAIATRAFERFAAAMEAERDRAGPAPMARLQGICAGYIAFAATHSGLFQLMFTTPGLFRTDPDLQRAGAHAYQVLRDACAPFATTPPETLEIAVWSLVHGYAQLGFAQAQSTPQQVRDVPEFATLLARIVADPGPSGVAQEALATPGTLG